MIKKLNGQATPYRGRHHQVLRKMSAVDMWAVSLYRMRSVKAAGAYLVFPVVSKVFLYLRVNSTKRGVSPMSS
jgi:hypothetical protein